MRQKVNVKRYVVIVNDGLRKEFGDLLKANRYANMHLKFTKDVKIILAD